MPCNQCQNPARCDRLGLCQEVKLPARQAKECIPNPAQLRAMARPTQPEPCKPGRRCERYARGLGACIAGECNPPEGVGVEAMPSGAMTAKEYLAKVEADPKRAAALQRARDRAAYGVEVLRG